MTPPALIADAVIVKPTVNMPDELEDRIESELSYGNSKSEWVRQTIRFRMHVGPILDELYKPHQREKREIAETLSVAGRDYRVDEQVSRD